MLHVVKVLRTPESLCNFSAQLPASQVVQGQVRTTLTWGEIVNKWCISECTWLLVLGPLLLRATCARMAGQSIGLHSFILVQTNFPYWCLCSLDTGHSAWASSSVSRDSLRSDRVFMREAPCPGMKIAVFAFQSSSWISRWQDQAHLPYSPPTWSISFLTVSAQGLISMQGL